MCRQEEAAVVLLRRTHKKLRVLPSSFQEPRSRKVFISLPLVHWNSHFLTIIFELDAIISKLLRVDVASKSLKLDSREAQCGRSQPLDLFPTTDVCEGRRKLLRRRREKWKPAPLLSCRCLPSWRCCCAQQQHFSVGKKEERRRLRTLKSTSRRRLFSGLRKIGINPFWSTYSYKAYKSADGLWIFSSAKNLPYITYFNAPLLINVHSILDVFQPLWCCWVLV